MKSALVSLSEMLHMKNGNVGFAGILNGDRILVVEARDSICHITPRISGQGVRVASDQDRLHALVMRLIGRLFLRISQVGIFCLSRRTISRHLVVCSH